MSRVRAILQQKNLHHNKLKIKANVLAKSMSKLTCGEPKIDVSRPENASGEGSWGSKGSSWGVLGGVLGAQNCKKKTEIHKKTKKVTYSPPFFYVS